MFKKMILISVTLAALVSCAHEKEEAFPGEFIGADYILSAHDAKRWVAASRQAELCIYPHLTRIQQAHFAKEDAYIHSQYVFFYPLEEIIGEQYVKIIQEDEKSMGYAQHQFKRFKNIQKFDPMEAQACQILRSKAKDDLAVVKGQYKSGMAEENKTDGKGADGVATNQNKFFFDIIKWGSALLL